MLIGPSRKRTQQPRGATSVNPAIARSRGLLALVSGHGVDLLRGVPATRQAGVVFTPSASGVGSAAPAFKASGNLSAGATGVSTGAVTDFVLLQGFSTAETYLYPCGTYDGSTGFAITAKHLSIGNRWGVFAGAAGLLDSGESIPTSGMQMLLVSRTAGGQFFLYRNGRFVVQRTAAVYSAAPTAPWVHGGLSSSAIDFNLATPVVLSGRFGRNLSETEIRELHENPWGLLGGERRRIWAAVPGGPVTHNLSAAALAQAAATAALDVQAGGTTVDLAAGGGAQAAASASLLKGVSLASAGLAVATGGASVAHVVPLQASAVAVAQAGVGLALGVTLSAAGLAQAAGAAGMAHGVPLAAAGAGQASGSAALSTSSGLELAAGAQAQASGGAVLSLVVNLSAAGVAQALATAGLAQGVPLAAAGLAQAGGSAALQVGAPLDLAAAGVAQATAGASLWVDVPLSAAALAQAAAAGSLQLSVPLAAAALAQAGGSAVLAGAVTLAAGGQAVATGGATLQVMGALEGVTKGLRLQPPVRRWAVAPAARVWQVRQRRRVWRMADAGR